MKARRGPKKAILAVAASILTSAYFMIRNRTAFRGLGPGHFQARDKAKAVDRLVRRLQNLGCQVEIKHAA